MKKASWQCKLTNIRKLSYGDCRTVSYGLMHVNFLSGGAMLSAFPFRGLYMKIHPKEVAPLTAKTRQYLVKCRPETI